MIRSLAAGWTKLASVFSHIRVVLFLSYFLIILICIASVGAVSFYISDRQVSEQAEQANFQIGRQIELSMDNDFRNKRYLLLAPYYDQRYIDGINDYDEMAEQEKFLFRQRLGDLYLKSFNTTPIEGFIRFQIYADDGQMLNASDNRRPWTAEQVLGQEWYLETVEKFGKVHFSGPILDEGAPENAAYSSSILIRDFANPDDFIVVRVEYSNELFRRISRNNNVSERSLLMILNERNLPVYLSNPERSEAADPALLARIAQGTGKFWWGEGDSEALVSYTRSEYSGWKTVLVTPKSEITGPLERIKTATFLTAIAAFALTGLISLYFGRRIAKPILSLYKSVSRVKRGDFSERAPVFRNDEIGRIATNFNEMQSEIQHLIETRYIHQIKLQEAELAMLYSQINPHFLYNTLDIVRAQADYYGVQDIGRMAQSLADMFRYNLRGGGDGMVTLRDELEQIDSYMFIQQIRFEDKLGYETDIEEELLGFPLVKMTLQPLVENAVFHGVERKRGRGVIRLTAKREGGAVRITVADDGVGMPPGRLEALRAELYKPLYSGSGAETGGRLLGLGLRNVYARYAIRLGEQFAMTVESAPGEGTEVSLTLPEDAAPLEQTGQTTSRNIQQ